MLLAIAIDFLGLSGRGKRRQLLQLTDLELVRRYQKSGDTEIISLLMERYKDLIIARTFQYLKDESETRDFIADLFLKLCEKFRQDHQIRSFKPWLRRMISNTLIDGSRKQKRFEQYLALQTEGIEEIDRKIALEVDGAHLAAALEELRPLPRMYIIQHFFLGKQNREIAQEQGLELNQVRGARTRALRALKELLGPEYRNYGHE